MIHRYGVTAGMKEYTKLLVLSVAMILLCTCVSAEETPPVSDTVNSDETSVERISSIDFEIFEDGAPAELEVDLGATTGETEVTNLIEQDTCVFFSGRSSLRISGSDSTTQWYSLSIDLKRRKRLLGLQ